MSCKIIFRLLPFSAILCFCFVNESIEMATGGLTDVRDATSEIQNICEQLKSAIEASTGQHYSVFNAVSYKSQVVAGTNYFVKIDVGDGKFIHVKIYQSLPHEGSQLSVSRVATGKTECDPIEYF